MSEQRVSDEQLAMVLAASKERDAMAERSMFYNLAYDLSDARTELTELERSFSLVNGLYHQLLKDATKDRADLARLSAELEGAREDGYKAGLAEAYQALREAHQKHNLDLQKDEFWQGKASGYGDSWQRVRDLKQGALSEHTQAQSEATARLLGQIAGQRDTINYLKGEVARLRALTDTAEEG
jgi:hypothetical protein